MLIALISLILLYGLKKNIIPTSFYNNLQHLANNKYTKIMDKTTFNPYQTLKKLPKTRLNKSYPLKIPRVQKPHNGNIKI